MKVLILFLFIPTIYGQRICHLTTNVRVWLEEEHREPCDIVEGNFILDQDTQYSGGIFNGIPGEQGFPVITSGESLMDLLNNQNKQQENQGLVTTTKDIWQEKTSDSTLSPLSSFFPSSIPTPADVWIISQNVDKTATTLFSTVGGFGTILDLLEDNQNVPPLPPLHPSDNPWIISDGTTIPLFITVEAGTFPPIIDSNVPPPPLSNGYTLIMDPQTGTYQISHSSSVLGPELERVFGNLTEIRGCLKITNFVGNQNLYFLANLKKIKCTNQMAARDGLINVVDIWDNMYLNYFGLNSLKTVEGPGLIKIRYDKSISNYPIMCYTKEELLFLAKQPNFKSFDYNYSPNPCDNNDPCLNPKFDAIDGFTTWRKYPANCTVFIGSIKLTGYIMESPVDFENFKSIEVIYGVLTIVQTLFDKFDVFPNLQAVYHCKVEEYVLGTMGTKLQNSRFHHIELGNNPRLTEMILPRLLTNIDILLTQKCFIKFCRMAELHENGCSLFQQFGNRCLALEEIWTYNSNVPLNTSIRYLSYFLVLPGFLLSFQVVGLVLFGNCFIILSHYRFFLATIFILSIGWAIELVVVSQDYQMDEYPPVWPNYPVPIVQSTFLENEVFKLFQQCLTALRHTTVLLFPALYLDELVREAGRYFSSKRLFIKKLVNYSFYLFLILFITIFTNFYNSIFILIRATKNPPSDIVDEPLFSYVHLAITTDSMQLDCLLDLKTGTRHSPSESSTEMVVDITMVKADIHGNMFDYYYLYSDVAIAVLFILTAIKQLIKKLKGDKLPWFLIILDFCIMKDWYQKYGDIRKGACIITLKPFSPEFLFALIIKLPCLTFSLVMYTAWRYLKYCHKRGGLERHKELRKMRKEEKVMKEFIISSLQSPSVTLTKQS